MTRMTCGRIYFLPDRADVQEVCAMMDGHPGACGVASAPLPLVATPAPKDTTKDRATAAVAAIEHLMAGELQSPDIGRFTRLEKLARMARALRTQYVRRVGDLERAGRGNPPNLINLADRVGGDDLGQDDFQEGGGDYMVRPRLGGGGDMQDLLRDAIATAQAVSQNKGAPCDLHPVEELERLIEVRKQLATTDTVDLNPITARIAALVAGVGTPPASVSPPASMIIAKEHVQ